jgi:hypothetical protein
MVVAVRPPQIETLLVLSETLLLDVTAVNVVLPAIPR